MAETVNGLTVQVRIWGTVVAADGQKQAIDENYTQTFADGTGSGQIGCVGYDQTRSLDTTTEDLQLDALNSGTAFATTSANNCKILYIRDLDEDTGDYLVLGGSAGGNEWDSGPFVAAGDKLKVGPKGIVLIVSPVDGYSITAGDDLQVEAVDDSTYRYIIGMDNA